MDLETAILNIAARRAAQLEREGLRIPLENDALQVLKEQRPQFFVGGVVQTPLDQLAKSRPVWPGNRHGKQGKLVSEVVD